jgi:ATP adenylyltransferase
MVAPYKHTGDMDELTSEELADLSSLMKMSVSLLRRAMNPQGFNLGMNIGRVAGAGVENHLHCHIVPRWSGDTNFMPVLSETSILPEALDRTFQRLDSVLKDMTREE